MAKQSAKQEAKGDAATGASQERTFKSRLEGVGGDLAEQMTLLPGLFRLPSKRFRCSPQGT